MLLIKNAFIKTMAGADIENGCILVDEGKIVAVGEGLTAPEGAEVIDAEGRLVTGQKPDYPIVGIGSMILGGILALMPATFVSFLMYVIGAVLVLGAVGQFLAIIAARRYGKVSLGYFTCPSLILLAGLYVTLKPMSPLSTAMYFLGWISLFYGIVEAVNAILFYFAKRRWEEQHEQLKKENAVIVVDNDSSAQSE
jgi:uncharacterized membrane protein HdeD (DUF308 family)